LGPRLDWFLPLN